MRIILGLVFSYFLMNYSVASEHSFGGSCGSQGMWTANAMNQSSAIMEALKELRSDENCKALTESLTFESLDMTSFKDSSQSTVAEEIGALRELLNPIFNDGNLPTGKLTTTLLGKTLDDAVVGKSSDGLEVNKRIQASVSSSLNMVNNLLTNMPNYTECLYNHQSSLLSIMSASAKILGSYASSGNANVTQVGNVIANFVKFLQDQRYRNIFKSLKKQEFWSSVSCLLESTTDAYCTAKDAQEMIHYVEKEKEIEKRAKDEVDHNPLEGYFLITREIPVISEWLQKVQFGVEPRLVTDADYKNQVLDNVLELLKDQNNVLAYYNDDYKIYQSLESDSEKKNHIHKMLQEFSTMIAGNSWRGQDRRGEINFFKMMMAPEKIPWYLIGRENPPAEVMANEEGRVVMDPWLYMKGKEGDFRNIPEFKDPDALMIRIKERLDNIIANGLRRGSSYFQQRLIVDMPNLVDQSLTGQTITVKEGLERTSNYLNRVLDRVVKDESGKDDTKLAATLASTITKIQRILDGYKFLEERLNHLIDVFDGKQKNNVNREFREALADDQEVIESTKGILNTVYDEFNVLFQRDTFLFTRMSTFVRYDYAYHTRNASSETMDQYAQELLIVSGRNLIDRLLSSSYGDNLADRELDLGQAQIINQNNIDALEQLLADSMVPYIIELSTVAQQGSAKPVELELESMKRYFLDSLNPKQNPLASLLRPITNAWYHRDRYPFLLYGFSLDPRIPAKNEDQYRNMERLRSKLCVQTLAFKGKAKFAGICEGAALINVGQIGEENLDLSLFYSHLVYDYIQSLETGSKKKISENRDQNICSLRNYRRRNQAYWLLKNPSR